MAQRAGYRLTLTGHSLGAATAVMLAMLLKRRGIDDVFVYAIATPACMAKELALECRDYVQSVAFRWASWSCKSLPNDTGCRQMWEHLLSLLDLCLSCSQRLLDCLSVLILIAVNPFKVMRYAKRQKASLD